MVKYSLEELPKPAPSSTVALKFDPAKIDLNTVSKIFDSVLEKYPDNPVILLPEPMSLDFMSKENLTKWYNDLAEFLDSIEE